MKKLASKLPSLAIYFAGMASFLIVDVVVSKYFIVQDVALWGFVKSALVMSSSVAIFGLDQVIVRHPSGLRLIAKNLAIRIPLVALIISAALALLDERGGFFFWLGCIFLSASLSIAFAIMRGAYRMSIAQFALNGWKSILLILILAAVWLKWSLNIQGAVALSLGISFVAVASYAVASQRWRVFYTESERETAPPSKARMLGDSKDFFLLGVSLTFSINLEQFGLNLLGHSRDSAILLAHSSVFLPAMIFLNGFLGFYLGPYFRRNRPQIELNEFKRINLYFVAAGLFLTVVSVIFGVVAFDRLYGDKYDFKLSIALPLVVLGFARFLYSVPSSFIGVASSSEHLQRFALSNLSFLGASLLAFAALLGGGLEPVYAILGASLLNWVLRVASGYFLIYKQFR